jgi:hypothetical protein
VTCALVAALGGIARHRGALWTALGAAAALCGPSRWAWQCRCISKTRGSAHVSDGRAMLGPLQCGVSTEVFETASNRDL